MNTYPTPQTINLIGDEQLNPIQVAYFSQQFRGQVYYAIAKAFYEEVGAGNISQAILGRRLNKDRATVSKWFSGPRNLTLDTVSEMLLAMGAEPRVEVCFFRDQGAGPNQAHPLLDELGASEISQEIPPLLPPHDKSSSAGSSEVNTTLIIFKNPNIPIQPETFTS